MDNVLCRLCGALLTATVVDLGLSPLCQTHIEARDLDGPEVFYPLRVRVCEQCLLVQLPEVVSPAELFSDYAYFSSYASSWVNHARRFVEASIERLHLGPDTRVVEVASNDGYLLQHFVARGIPCLGIEPAANVAAVAVARGVPTVARFFGRATARAVRADPGPADLVIGNNVLAHVPDLNDFIAGLQILLQDHGVITMEFPHLLRLIEGNQFDTIYHEHFSYLAFFVVERAFARHALTVFDVEELATHGGSLRIHVRHAAYAALPVTAAVHALRSTEYRHGLHQVRRYSDFAGRVHATKRALLGFLIEAARNGQQVVGYGAPGKGNTLLNYCGIRTDLLAYTVDRSPHKQGRFTPGTRIPIHAPERIFETRPDYVLILPWNLADEIVDQMVGVRDWGGRFVVPIPELRVL